MAVGGTERAADILQQIGDMARAGAGRTRCGSAVTGDREARIAAAVAARPPGVRLADAIIEAVVEQYTNTGEHNHNALLLITTRTALLTRSSVPPPTSSPRSQR